MRTTADEQFYLNHYTGDKSWTDITFQLIEPDKLVRAQTELGSYSIELQPDGKTLAAPRSTPGQASAFARRSFRLSTERNGKLTIIIVACSPNSN